MGADEARQSQESEEATKRIYAKPCLQVYGTLAELTATSNSKGGHVDASGGTHRTA